MTEMSSEQISLSMLNEFDSQTIGQDIIRYVSLPSFLGQEKDILLYFIGRTLARKIHTETLDDIIYIFSKFRWGQLELVKDKKNQLIFHLMSDEVVKRIEAPVETEFRLEAGFIAEAIQNLTNRPAECSETINERLYRVQFKVVFTD